MGKIEFGYFYQQQAEQYSFYRMPKLLFTSDYFDPLSCEAKVLYGLMLDRMSLSRKNEWIDEENRIYIIFQIEEIMELLRCSRKTAVNRMNELNKIGLVEKKRMGLGKPNVIFVKDFMSVQYEAYKTDAPMQTSTCEMNQNGNVQMPESTENTLKCRNYTSRSVEIGQMDDWDLQKCKNYTSRNVEITLQEVQKGNASNTDLNDTEFNNPLPLHSVNNINTREDDDEEKSNDESGVESDVGSDDGVDNGSDDRPDDEPDIESVKGSECGSVDGADEGSGSETDDGTGNKTDLSDTKQPDAKASAAEASGTDVPKAKPRKTEAAVTKTARMAKPSPVSTADLIRKYRTIIEQNIAYDELTASCTEEDRGLIDEIVDVMAETVGVTRNRVSIAGAEYPYEMVKGKLLKLNQNHIRSVADAIKCNVGTIRNKRAYILTCLFNALSVSTAAYYGDHGRTQQDDAGRKIHRPRDADRTCFSINGTGTYNKTAGFPQREYDMLELERDILSKQFGRKIG